MQRLEQTDSASGLAFGIAAYGLWGLMPLYFREVRGIGSLELLAHRIVWSVVLLAGALTLLRRWPAVRACFIDRRTGWLLLASSVFLAVNWLVYIHGVDTERIIQCSLGYFINPLLNVLLGVVFFRERPRAAQWLALVLAGTALIYLMSAQAELPWIAFTLATSFALYGLIRKVVPVDALVGVTVETLFLVPISGIYLAWWLQQPQSKFGRVSWQFDLLIAASGVTTVMPLLCFGLAVRHLRLSTLGFLQYLAPSLQFLLAVLVMGEEFRHEQQVSFGLIWAALALATVDSLVARRRVRAETQPLPRAAPSEEEEIECISKSRTDPMIGA